MSILVSMLARAGEETPPPPPVQSEPPGQTVPPQPGQEISANQSENPETKLPELLQLFFPPENLDGRGLLHLQDVFPLAILHLQIPTNTLEILPKGGWKIRTGVNWSNTFAFEDQEADFIVDAETFQVEFGGWYALAPDFYLGAGFSIISRGAGILDPVVEGFHDAFGFSDGGRGDFPTNSYAISVTDGGSTHLLESGTGAGDVILKSHWILNRGNSWFPAAAVQLFAGLPTSTAGFGSNGLDLGASLSLYKTVLKIVHLYGIIGGTYLTDPEVEHLRFERVNYTATGGVEVAIFKSFSMVFQASYYSPLLRSPAVLDQSRNYLAAGFKWEVVKRVQVELSLLENLAPFNNSADLGIFLGFDFRF